MLFYLEMINLNLEIRQRFLPLEFEVSVKGKRRLARGMDKEEYLTIAKNAALGAMEVGPDSLHIEKVQRKFYDYKLDDFSRPVVNYLKQIHKEIYNSQATQSERDSMREFNEEHEEDKKFELERQQKLRELAKKLQVIRRERMKNRNNPYPYCNIDYGSVKKVYDPVTGKTKLSLSPADVSHFF
jgi:preprotein translocase subunit Sss1